MAPAPLHRDAILRTAARLFRQQGFAATGLNQIVQESGAPKGSLYHYFPEGKESIGAATVLWAGQRVEQTLADMAGDIRHPADLLRRYAERLAGWMAVSGFSDGCPIATTLLEMAPASQAVREAGQAALRGWAHVLQGALQAQQVPPARAARLAAAAIAILEGALIQARVALRAESITDAAEEMALAFEAAVHQAHSQAQA